MTPEKLMELAKEAMTHAYAPYSGYQVGAALLCRDGSVYLGCNLENAAFSPTVCAERTAFVKAISEGRREFVRIAIYGEGENYCMPCGACRQFMVEFAGDTDMEVLCTRSGGRYVSYRLSQLMPHPFVL